MLAGVTDCRRSREWDCRGRLELGFKPRGSSHTRGREPHGSEGEERGPYSSGGEERGPRSFGEVNREDHVVLKERREDHVVLGCSFLPHGFGLTGDCGSHTADGARSLNHRLILLSLRYGTLTGQREKEGLCVSVGILKHFSILMKTLSHYSNSV